MTSLSSLWNMLFCNIEMLSSEACIRSAGLQHSERHSLRPVCVNTLLQQLMVNANPCSLCPKSGICGNEGGGTGTHHVDVWRKSGALEEKEEKQM